MVESESGRARATKKVRAPAKERLGMVEGREVVVMRRSRPVRRNLKMLSLRPEATAIMRPARERGRVRLLLVGVTYSRKVRRTIEPCCDERALRDARLGDERLGDTLVLAQRPALHSPSLADGEHGPTFERRPHLDDSSDDADRRLARLVVEGVLLGRRGDERRRGDRRPSVDERAPRAAPDEVERVGRAA